MLLHEPGSRSPSARPTTTDAPTEPPTALTDATAVRDAVAALSWLDREALLLRVVGRASLAAIAERTGTTVPMVKVRIRRAAARVETAVGHWPLDGTRPAPSERTQERALEDATLGITPMLADRLEAALRGQREPGRMSVLGHRIRGVLDAVAAHLQQLAMLSAVVAFAALSAMTLAVGAA